MRNFNLVGLIVFSSAYIIMFALVLLMYYLTQFAWIVALALILVLGFMITIAILSE